MQRPTVQDDRALTLLGYLTFLDLPKPDAADTIAHMHNAGITVTMLTGDEPQVARTVARKVGINARRVVTGRTLDDMTDTALGTELRRVNVFAKLTPEHKARIVFLGSAIRIQNGIADGIELAVQNNNILHLTAENDATNASHIEF